MSKELENESLTKLLEDTWMSKNDTFIFPSSISEKSDEEHLDDSCQRTHRLQHLKNRWNEAITTILKLYDEKDFGKDDGTCNKWFDEIVKRHSSSNNETTTTTQKEVKEERFYHTLVHLEEMLGYIDIFLNPSSPSCDDDQQQHRAVLILSTFFHDVIYNAKSSTNEEDSAVLFCKFANEVLLLNGNNDEEEKEMTSSKAIKKLVKRTESYILATKSHSASSLTEDDDDDTIKYYLHLFLDIDMSVLGKTSTAYNFYAYAIRQEYIFVLHDTYCEKRAQVLETFLQREYIFENEIMRKVLEEQCRVNLKREIELLKQGVIPKKGGEHH